MLTRNMTDEISTQTTNVLLTPSSINCSFFRYVFSGLNKTILGLQMGHWMVHRPLTEIPQAVFTQLPASENPRSNFPQTRCFRDDLILAFMIHDI